jgi:hypothetical protein
MLATTPLTVPLATQIVLACAINIPETLGTMLATPPDRRWLVFDAVI